MHIPELGCTEARWVLIPVLQGELSDTGDLYLATQLYVIPIHPHPQLATSLADLSDLQFRNPFLGCPVGTHRAVGGAADLIFIDTCNGSEHPGDVILRKFARGICRDDVLLNAGGFLPRFQVTSVAIPGPEFIYAYTYQYFGVELELIYILVLI